MATIAAIDKARADAVPSGISPVPSCPGQRVPVIGGCRQRRQHATTKPSLIVVASLDLGANSLGTQACPWEMQSTSGSLRGVRIFPHLPLGAGEDSCTMHQGDRGQSGRQRWPTGISIGALSNEWSRMTRASVALQCSSTACALRLKLTCACAIPSTCVAKAPR